jgi:hypothetical protein
MADSDRRSVLSAMLALPFAGVAAAGLGTHAGMASALPVRRVRNQVAPQPPIVRRAEWGGDLRPKGPIPTEEVRYLLVHHTAEPGSDYEAHEVVGMLRSIYGFHTGSSKGWPDVAYNFFVDKFGTIYEGRTGSVDGPLRGSATGGNQGYSQLCCFIGDFTAAPPPAPALASMYSLLAWLADRYDVDTAPGATVTFTSLGSNKWPAGAVVNAATISAHRDMSQTTCPGEACYALVRSVFPQEVSARRGTPLAPTTTASTAPAVTEPGPSSTAAEPATSAPTTTEPAATLGGEDVASSSTGRDAGTNWPLVGGVAVIGAAAAGGIVALARRREPASAGTDLPGAIAWRVAGGATDPLVHALATAARPTLGAGGDWWDELAEHWQVAVPIGASAGAHPAEPGSFLVASDGQRALVRLVGDASGAAVQADGSTVALTAPGVTKVWLNSASIRLGVDGQVTEVSAAGISGPLDRSMRPRA